MCNSLYGGGAEKILQTLLGQLDQSIYDITLYSVVSDRVDTSAYPKGITFKTIFGGRYSKNKNRWLIYIINKFKLLVYNNLPSKIFYKCFVRGCYDVEVAFIEGYSTKIISGSTSTSKKIAWVHIDLYQNHWTKISYKNLNQEIFAYKQFDQIISVSQSVQDSFSRKFGIKEKLSVKYNPINREDIIKKSFESIDSIKRNSNHIYQLVAVGRLDKQKSFDRLINVSNKLLKDGFNIRLIIIGEGTEREKLEELIKKYNLFDRVHLLGFQSNPYKYIRASDVFVSSSKSEGFSTVVAEALVLGKPIVATDCAGMTELLGDSEFGIITKNTELGLYNGVREMLSNEEILLHYKEKSEERSSYFDMKKMMLELEEIWK